MITETSPAFADEAIAEQWAAMIVVNREPAAEALGRWLGDPDSGEAFTSEYMGWWTGLPAEDKLRASHIAQTPDTILQFLAAVPAWQDAFDDPEGRTILYQVVAGLNLTTKITWLRDTGIDCFATDIGRQAALFAVNRPAIQAGFFVVAQAAKKVATQPAESEQILRSRIEQAATNAFEQFARENLITWESLWSTAL